MSPPGRLGRIARPNRWKQILALYDQLLPLSPTAVMALNRAVAFAEVDRPREALELIDSLPLDGYYLYHAIRADLLRRPGQRCALGPGPTCGPTDLPDVRPRAATRCRFPPRASRYTPDGARASRVAIDPLARVATLGDLCLYRTHEIAGSVRQAPLWRVICQRRIPRRSRVRPRQPGCRCRRLPGSRCGS